MCLHSPRRALIDGLSAWMCQTGKINYRSPKQYLYWLSWLEFAFVRKISFPLSKQANMLHFPDFLFLESQNFQTLKYFDYKGRSQNCINTCKMFASFISLNKLHLYFGVSFFCHFNDFLHTTEIKPCQTFQKIMELKSTHRQPLAFIQGWGGRAYGHGRQEKNVIHKIHYKEKKS